MYFPSCRRYVVIKASVGFAVCRLILKTVLFYSCLDFTQNLGKPPFSTILLLEQDLNCRILNQINKLIFRYNFFTADNRLIRLLPCISQFSIIAAKLPHRIQSQGSFTIHLAQNKVIWLKGHPGAKASTMRTKVWERKQAKKIEAKRRGRHQKG